jgi:hypothetical protein
MNARSRTTMKYGLALKDDRRVIKTDFFMIFVFVVDFHESTRCFSRLKENADQMKEIRDEPEE